jgi:hypothetical protein
MRAGAPAYAADCDGAGMRKNRYLRRSVLFMQAKGSYH